MKEESHTLNKNVIRAMVAWLVLNRHEDVEGTIKLSELVKCWVELGVLKATPTKIWNAVNKTLIPASFPVGECAKWTMIIFIACNKYLRMNWEDQAMKWIENNKGMKWV
jgi:hypothetical protein